MRSLAVIILDACRYDHLGCYGYPKNTSPNIDEFSKDCVIFRKAYSLGSSTDTSIPKLFSGNPKEEAIGFTPTRTIRQAASLLPKDMKISIWLNAWRVVRKTRLSARILKNSLIPAFEKKFTTCCVTANPYYSFGLRTGFGYFYDLSSQFLQEGEEKGYIDPRDITDKALEFLDTGNAKFLVCHYLQPHHPYVAPFAQNKFATKEVIKMDEQLRNGNLIDKDTILKLVQAYDDNIRWVDEALRPILERLIELDSVIVITSDHGECLGEHNRIGHPKGLSCEELNHIPLIIYGFHRGAVNARFWLHELFPYLLEKVK